MKGTQSPEQVMIQIVLKAATVLPDTPDNDRWVHIEKNIFYIEDFRWDKQTRVVIAGSQIADLLIDKIYVTILANGCMDRWIMDVGSKPKTTAPLPLY